jgi:hypothetical protein
MLPVRKAYNPILAYMCLVLLKSHVSKRQGFFWGCFSAPLLLEWGASILPGSPMCTLYLICTMIKLWFGHEPFWTFCHMQKIDEKHTLSWASVKDLWKGWWDHLVSLLTCKFQKLYMFISVGSLTLDQWKFHLLFPLSRPAKAARDLWWHQLNCALL